jgi:hypothetical protein
MRKSITTAAVAVLALVLAGVALAKFTQIANVSLTAGKAGKSTGIIADIHSSTDVGKAPKEAKLVVLTFPANTKFNIGRVKPCTLSDKQLMSPGGSCPADTQLGSGSAKAVAFPLPQVATASVKAFASGSHQMVLVTKATKPVAVTVIIRETVAGTKLSIPVPQTKIQTFSVILTSLKLTVPALGSGKNALITAGRCTAHKFVVKSHFVYTDHSTVDLESSSPCS